MKTKNISLILVAAGFAALGACKKDFLQTTPTSIITDAAVWGDSSLAEAYVTGRYIGVGGNNDGGKPGFGRAFEDAWMSSVTDESVVVWDNNTWFVQQGALTPDRTGWMSDTWIRSYRSIREVNYAFQNIDKVPMSAYGKDRLKGELHFIRAYRYFDLIRNFGDVPLVGDRVYNLEDTNFDSLFVRKPVQEAIQYAISELDAAAPLMQDKSYPIGRGSYAAALALKARLLLYAASPLYTKGVNDKAKWTAAANAAKAVMDLHKFSLYNNYKTLFTISGTTEDIFERVYSPTNEHTNLELVNGPNGYGGWGGNTPMQNLVDDYEMADGSRFDWNNPVQKANPYQNRDPRFYASILYNGAPYRTRNVETFLPGGKDSKDGNGNWNTSPTGYYVRKYINESNPVENPNQTAYQPWKYLRYAEVLLNYAEAQNEAAGPDGSVYDAINAIRFRSNMPELPKGLSADSMRSRIRNERRIEMAFEEQRYFDVRRWKIAETTENIPAYGILPSKQSDGSIVYTKIIALANRKFDKAKNYWVPIPQSEINSSGKKLRQNDGY
ncbi:RagB/SusD family nutrient uptake outer membrane protein [Chitinophaga arvensicola]|uniref:Starch-binding associating with outer membrane n=1 Tax=Chitinophaga arvensicola TaxID=29529 RepID=A0A1I0RRB9_9BACT|nr:RagB/SusD family nutrient uptake outer membrane protein [Chitinophaga arvensicola]SEW43898.1 Starch-binding associating with outer membrane [Chitinophaga arvensicola]